jgi:excisionase family DNA binding protein
MNHDFAMAFEAMMTSVAKEAASEAIRQFRMEERQRQRESDGDRLLLRSHEAAEQLAISTATLDRFTRSGEIPCVRVGRSIRYSTETLREWIRQKEMQNEDADSRGT